MSDRFHFLRLAQAFLQLVALGLQGRAPGLGVGPFALQLVLQLHHARLGLGYLPQEASIFRKLNAQLYLLEFDGPRAGSLDALRLIPEGKGVVLGLVTTKSPVLESKDDLKRRIDAAARPGQPGACLARY